MTRRSVSGESHSQDMNCTSSRSSETVETWLKDLAGAMDETKQEMITQMQFLIDRDYVKVVSDRGFARYRARTKDEIQNNI